MSKQPPYDEPSEVDAEEGEVTVDGPDGVAVSFTPEAALETSDRLLKNGLKATGQQVREADDAKGWAGMSRERIAQELKGHQDG